MLPVFVESTEESRPTIHEVAVNATVSDDGYLPDGSQTKNLYYTPIRLRGCAELAPPTARLREPLGE